jgi:putative redox protein
MSDSVKVSSAGANFATEILAGNHRLIADEPVAAGGGDAGPAPKEILLAALGACTAITLRMYAQRKQWPLAEVAVELSFGEGSTNDATIIERDVRLVGELGEDQRQRLLQIANACPLHKILTGSVQIPTKLVG